MGVDSGSLQADSQPNRLSWSQGRRPLDAVLHSSNKPGELSQWLCYDESTIKINIGICIIIIFLNLLLLLLYYYYYYYYYLYGKRLIVDQIWSKSTSPGQKCNRELKTTRYDASAAALM